jgi:hypothetical protein
MNNYAAAVAAPLNIILIHKPKKQNKKITDILSQQTTAVA